MDDDLTGLDEALRAALGPESSLWVGNTWTGDAWPEGVADDVAIARGTSARDSVVHGVRRRRGRRIRVVTGAGAVVIAIGLALSQVLVGTTAVPARHGAKAAKTAKAAQGVTYPGPDGSTMDPDEPAAAAECQPEGTAALPCGVLTAATATLTPDISPTPAAQAANASPAPASTSTTRTSTTRTSTTRTSTTSSRVLDVGVSHPVSVLLPNDAVWGRPVITTTQSSGTTSPVVVRAPPVTSVTAVHGWGRFVVEGVVQGTATVEVTGSCSSGTLCANGHTLFVLKVVVGAT